MERGSLALVLGTKFPVDKLESLHPSLEPFLVGLEHFVGKLGQDFGHEGGGDAGLFGEAALEECLAHAGYYTGRGGGINRLDLDLDFLGDQRAGE